MRKIIGVAAVLACCGLAYGDIWNEVPDAGQNNIGAAQTPIVGGLLTSIVGTISPANDVDLYGPFTIFDPAGFLASTLGSAIADTELFLFNASGLAVVHNDDAGGGFQSIIGGQAGFLAGQYYLAIGAFSSNPLDVGANLVFDNANVFPGPLPGQRGPQAGSTALNSWSTSGTATGGYTIALSGVAPIPAPGSVMLALFGLGGLALIRRC